MFKGLFGYWGVERHFQPEPRLAALQQVGAWLASLSGSKVATHGSALNRYPGFRGGTTPSTSR